MNDNIKNVNRNLILMCLIVFLNNINFCNTIAILYYKYVTNSFVLGMSIFSITTISSAIFELPTGIISDKIGRKKTIVYGSSCSVLSAIILFLANNYYLLILFAIINGIEMAFFSGNNDAYVYDNLCMINNKEKYINSIGKVKSMEYLAGAISGLIGAGLLYCFSYKLIIGISIIPKVIQLVISLFLKAIKNNETNTNSNKKLIKGALKESLENKLLLKKVLYDGILQSTNESCYQFRSAFYETVWPIWAIGIPGILSNIGAFISNWCSEKLISKTSRKKYWFLSHSYSMFSNTIAVITNNIISPIIMISNSLFHSDFIDSEIEQKLYKDEYRASMGSIKSFIQSILFAVFSVILGLIADYFNIVTSFIIFQLINIIPIIMNSKIIENVEKNYKN